MDTLVSETITYFKDKRPSSAIEMVRVCMELAEQLKITGYEKSILVTSTLSLIVSDHYDKMMPYIQESILDNMKTIIESNMLQPTMDTIADAAKGRFEFNKPNQRIRNQVVSINNWNAHVFGQ